MISPIDQKPTITLIAGINGAGKTTLYTILQEKYNANMGVRICPDEILIENEGNWEDYKDVFASGRVAINMIDECIAKKQSFNWEFTLISNYVIKVFRRAKEAGFQIRLNFILVDDVEMSLQRIQKRVENGGHGIPENVVRSRFDKQLINMEEALKLADMSVFYDNYDFLKVIGFCTKEQPLVLFDKNTQVARELIKRTNANIVPKLR